MNSDIKKAALRRTLLARRKDHQKINKTSLNQSITESVVNLKEVEQASIACVYVSIPGEVETHAMIDKFEEKGIVVLVPQIVGPSRMQAVRFPGWTAMRPGPLGILAPLTGLKWERDIDVAIIPGLGFSPVGDRLGLGVGFYDRWLEECFGVTKIGVGFEYQIVSEIPSNLHDVKMDLVVTESHILRAPKERL
jgi:5-formyltetrahydrofolate cyclo-ligase